MSATVTVHRYEDSTPGAWGRFIADMQSGQTFECDEEMYYYWLEVLPPVWMGKAICLHGRDILTHFGFAEGADLVTAFWRTRENGVVRHFGCRTDIMNPYA